MRALIWCAVSTKVQADQDRLSLPEQERLARDHAARHNWTVVDVLLVPGHSRDYIDIHQCAADMLRQGIDAYSELLAHLAARDFDVLITRDGDRFARTQSLHAYVTESIISINARIYSLQDGWIDDKNYRMWTAMSGYKSASEMDRLINGAKAVRRVRAQSGILNNSIPLLSHLPLYDHHHNRVGTIINESARDLFRVVATLIVEGIAWDNMGLELAARLGVLNPRTNRPYTGSAIRKIIYNPGFWGHSGQFYANKYGPWAYDPTIPPPAGVTIHYNTHTPFWAADWSTVHNGQTITLADIFAALRYREELVLGRRRSHNIQAFSGLLICQHCRHPYRARRPYAGQPHKPQLVYWGCSYEKYDPATGRKIRTCPNTRFLRDEAVREYLQLLLVEIITSQDLAQFFGERTNTDQAALREESVALDKSIIHLTARLNKLILDRADAPPAADDHYRDLIQSTTIQLDALRHNLATVQARLSVQTIQPDQKQAAMDLAARTLDQFWSQDSTTINKALHRLFGDYRLICDHGLIIGIDYVKPRRRASR